MKRIALLLLAGVGMLAASPSQMTTREQVIDRLIRNERELERLNKEQSDDLENTKTALDLSKTERERIQTAADDLLADRDRVAGIANKAIAQSNKAIEFESEMHKWIGFGAIWYGVKLVFWHCLATLAAFAAVMAALSFFFPPVATVIMGILQRIANVFVPKRAV